MSPKDCRKPAEKRPGRLFLSAVFERAKEFNLSPSKRLVLCALFRYLGDKDYCFPSQQSLAEDTGLTERTVRTLLKELAGKDKIIEITTRKTTGRKHGNHAYEYRLIFPQKESQTGNLKQNQTGNLRTPKRKSAAIKPEIRNRQTGNLRHSKVPEKLTSHERTGAEYVRKRSKNRSSNQSGDDALFLKTQDKKNSSRKRRTEKRSCGYKEKVSPKNKRDSVIPPDPGDDLLRRVYGIIPPAKDLLAVKPGSVNLMHYLRPFQTQKEMKRLFSEMEILVLDIPGPHALEARFSEFVDLICSSHFKGESGEGFRVMALRACRGGFLNRCGFRAFCERGLPKEYLAAHPWANCVFEEEPFD